MSSLARPAIPVSAGIQAVRSRDLAMYAREARADLLRMWRTPGSIVPMLVLPWSFYGLFGVVFPHRGSSQAVYLLATYGVFAAMAPCLFGFGAAIAHDRESGVLALKQASPLPPGAFFVARLATAVTFTLAVLLGLYALAIFGAGVSLSAAAWVELITVHLAGVVPLCLLGLCIGLRAQSTSAVAITNLLFFGLSVLSGLWFPIFEFPHVMQLLAQALPPAHLAALALSAAGQPSSGHPLEHFAVILGFAALFGFLAARGWRRGF